MGNVQGRAVSQGPAQHPAYLMASSRSFGKRTRPAPCKRHGGPDPVACLASSYLESDWQPPGTC